MKQVAWWCVAAVVGMAAAVWLDATLWRVSAGLAALLIVAAPRLPWPRDVPRAARRAALLVLLAIAATAQATSVELWSFVSSPWVRVWNVYHYYLGAKYFGELGYEDLYVATLAADDAGYWREVRTIRDQASYAKVPRRQAVAAYQPLDHFTAARWQSFERDLAALAKQRPPRAWRGIFHDRGYNPSPAWTLVGGLLTRLSADVLWALKLLCSLDLLALAATVWLLARSFGSAPAAAFVLLLVLTPVNDGRLVGGFLQYDWLCALAAGFACLRRGRPLIAGSLMAYAVATRIFPVILLAAAAVPVVRRFILQGRLLRRDVRFFAAAAAVTLALVAASSLAYGADAWQRFADNITHHSSEHRFGDKRIGLTHVFTRDVRSFELAATDGERRTQLAAQQPLRLAAGGVLIGLWLLASWRRSMPDALLLGVVPFFVLTVSSRYYWSCLALLPLLAAAGIPRCRRTRLLVALQLGVLVAVSLYAFGHGDDFAVYSVFNLALIAFFVLLTATFMVADLRVFRRLQPLGTWHRSAVLAGLFFAGIFLLLVWLRAPVPGIPIRDVDESVSALIAASWLDGGVPYRDAIDQRGPVTYALYAAVFAVAGVYNMQAVHWALLGLVLAACWVTWRIGRCAALGADGAVLGYLGALFLAVASFSYRRSQMLAFHTEWPMMLADAIAMLLVWQGLRRRSAWRLIAAGALFAVGFLSKQPGIFDAGAAALFVLAWQHRRRALLGAETLRIAARLAAGCFATLAACAAYFALAGALRDFVYYYWTYNVEHYTAVVPMADRLAGLDPFAHSRHYVRANPLLAAGGLWTLAVAAWGWIRHRRTDLRLLVALWLLFGYFGASYSGRNFGHYFIQIIVPACLAAAFMVHDLWRLLAQAQRRWPRVGDLTIAGRAAVVIGVTLALALPVARFGDDIAWRNLWRDQKMSSGRQRLLEAIRARSRPDEPIFVWGYYPELYMLAPRPPASRYSNTNYLTGLLPWENSQPDVDTSAHIVPGAWDILIAELETSRPKLVIDTAVGNHRAYAKYPIERFPALVSYLEAGYRREDTVRDRRGRPVADLWVRR